MRPNDITVPTSPLRGVGDVVVVTRERRQTGAVGEETCTPCLAGHFTEADSGSTSNDECVECGEDFEVRRARNTQRGQFAGGYAVVCMYRWRWRVCSSFVVLFSPFFYLFLTLNTLGEANKMDPWH